MPFFSEAKNNSFFDNIFLGTTECFYNLSIDCSCLKKKYARKKGGSPCLFLKYAKQKANLKAICYVFVAIATNSVVLKITEFKLEILFYLSQPVSVKWNSNKQNLRVSNCRTPKLLKTVSSHLKLGTLRSTTREARRRGLQNKSILNEKQREWIICSPKSILNIRPRSVNNAKKWKCE